MSTKTKKLLLISILAFMSVYFTGCINLSKKETPAERVINNNQGVFKSVDGGKTWSHKVNVEGGGYIDNVQISAIRIDPKDDNILYLGTVSMGLYKTENGGDTWAKVVDEGKVLSPTATINEIAIEKNNPKNVYMAATNNGKGELLKSEDSGKTWIESYIVNENIKTVFTVEIDPVSPNVVYIGTEQGGLIRSENRGKTWEPVLWFGAKSKVLEILIDTKNNNGLMVRLSDNIQKSTDKGKTWRIIKKEIKKALPKAEADVIQMGQINSITINPIDPLIIYLTYKNLVLVTRDGGENWEILDTITPAKTVVGTVPRVKQIGLIDNTVYYGAGNAIYKSEDAGKTWASYPINIKGDVRYTESDHSNKDIIYVGSFYIPPPEPAKKKSMFNF